MNMTMRFPNGRKKAVSLSYDDGVEQDIRLVEIMKEHGLKGTFNLNSGLYAKEGTTYPEGIIHRRMTKSAVTELFEDSGVEVAVHGLTHPFLEQLPTNVCVREVAKDRENLEQQFHRFVKGMAYPYGTYSDEVVQILKQTGIAYARTTISSRNFKIPKDWLRLEATCHHNDERLEELEKQFVEGEVMFNREPWLFYLWGHSYEFERDDNWDVIEQFASYVGGREDIWYATNLEIYEYVEAYRRLENSMDGTRIYNPTLKEIFFETANEISSIKPGETIVC